MFEKVMSSERGGVDTMEVVINNAATQQRRINAALDANTTTLQRSNGA